MRKIKFGFLPESWQMITTNEFTIHLMVMVIFTSIIGPFGGFFASGLKRALNVKDFSNIIPGHGGVTDRLDCIILTMIFTWVYLSEIVKGKSHSLGSVISYSERLQTSDL